MRKGSLLFKEEKSSKGLLSATKVVFFWSDFYETWSSRKIGDTGLGDRQALHQVTTCFPSWLELTCPVPRLSTCPS